MCSRTKAPVVASGGVSSLADLRALASLVPIGVEGAIVGKALYAGAFTLAEALAEVSSGRDRDAAGVVGRALGAGRRLQQGGRGGRLHLREREHVVRHGEVVHEGDAAKQTTRRCEHGAALEQFGAGLPDVVQTRMFVTDISRWPEIGDAHRRRSATSRRPPA